MMNNSIIAVYDTMDNTMERVQDFSCQDVVKWLSNARVKTWFPSSLQLLKMVPLKSQVFV